MGVALVMEQRIVERTAQVLVLQNDELRLTIRPDLGGRIDQLQDCKTGREWLWHPSDYNPDQTRSLSINAGFDQHWTGGWDEIFPNDAAGTFQERNLVDHGELWSQAWDIVSQSSQHVTLRLQCQTVPVQVEKTLRLHDSLPEMTIEYRFQNQSEQSIPFLFKQHCAIAIEAGDEILLPDCWVEPAVPEFSTWIGRAEKTAFPQALAADGSAIDLRYAPPATSQLQEFYYSSNLAIGQCGIRNQTSQSRLQMEFDTSDFPYVWVFQSYGGWNGRYVVVLEPCTTMPYDLDIAYRNGTIAQLQPQEQQHRKLTVRLQRDRITRKIDQSL
ncbi:MAG: hypothetical protein Kow00121_17810 [Elainellaceae cyanobacterium]